MQFKYVMRSVIAILVMLSLSIAVYAQEENLLENPGFEDGFDGSQVGNDWVSWVSNSADAPGFQEAPEYLAATSASDKGLIPQVRSGDEAQSMFSFFATHDAGIYQQVDVTEGTELRFSIYAHVFSNNLADVDRSENPGGVTIRVGIDPNGGTDPFANDIVYTEPFITYDTFVQYSVIATAESDTVTVFVRSTITEPVQNTIVFLDDAVLNVTPESSEPDETDEPVVTDEPEKTEEAVETEEPTEEPTDEPTEDPVSDDPTPTREGEPIETDEPTDEPVETEEPETEEPVETDEPTDEPETEEPATDEPTEEPTEESPISEEFPGQIFYTVRNGDTVGQLAVRYGSTTEAIIQANGLDSSALIFVGQGLIIPVRIVPATETPSPTPVVTETETDPGSGGVVDDNTYIVQAGDTLSSIARQFNTTVGALIQLNGIANPNTIFVGQALNLPGTGGTEATPTTEAPVETEEVVETEEATAVPTEPVVITYVVQPGDNLYRIALRNGVSLVELAEVNDISNYSLIFVGQVLTIP